MDINLLVKLTAKAWSLEILNAMVSGVAGRQAALIHATGAGRTAFGQSMTHLIALGLVERNPGHGHPLRPEFRLTAEGKHIGTVAQTALTDLSDPNKRKRLRRAWTVPLLTATTRPIHFSQIGQQLPMITDRSLSINLQKLEAENWVRRDVDPSLRPLRPTYTAMHEGARIGAQFQTLLL